MGHEAFSELELFNKLFANMHITQQELLRLKKEYLDAYSALVNRVTELERILEHNQKGELK